MTNVNEVFALDALLTSYANALDGKDAVALCALFVPTGRLTAYRPEAKEPTMDLVGTDQLARIVSGLARYTSTFHAFSNSAWRIDGTAAVGTSYCLARHAGRDDGGEFANVAPVMYTDRCVRTPDGWKFELRVARRLWLERHPIVATP
jgi:hypothetical protein